MYVAWCGVEEYSAAGGAMDWGIRVGEEDGRFANVVVPLYIFHIYMRYIYIYAVRHLAFRICACCVPVCIAIDKCI